MSKDCKRSIVCAHCGEINTHHRCLCPKKYTSDFSTAHLVDDTIVKVKIGKCAEENVLVSSGETVLMQTAKIQGHSNSEREHVSILLDSGSQRTYVTENLAEKLMLKREREEEIEVVTF